MRVYIDQDLCTGDGLCSEICPSVFALHDDGLAYVKTPTEEGGVDDMLEVSEDEIALVTEACEECPGECIYLV